MSKEIWSPSKCLRQWLSHIHILNNPSPEQKLSQRHEGAIIYECGLATSAFLWTELLVNQTEIPDLQVLENLLKIATLLQKYRDTLFKGAYVTITSGWRSLTYNKKIGGAAQSFHIKGMALDFTVSGLSPTEVQKMLDPIHKGGLEYASTWTHIDIRPEKARFVPKAHS